MVAQELRIGNLIEQGVIEMMSENAVWINEKLLLIDEIQPIPLTEEWLVRFGIEKQTGYNELGLEMIYLYDKYSDLECSFIELKHVHQLQNLYFALTQKELTL